MLKIKIISALLLVTLISHQTVAVAPKKMSYLELDNKIIGAYNNNPRNTTDVYVYSMFILQKSNQDKTMSGKAWLLKAKKLITVSCFYECTQAIDRKLYRNAFVWAQRGIKRGTTTGSIGDVPVKSLYKYLDFASKELKKTPMVKNSNQTVLQQQIDDYQTILTRTKLRPTGYNTYKLREKLLHAARLLIKKLPIKYEPVIIKTVAKIIFGSYSGLWCQWSIGIDHKTNRNA